uniref:Uncharacterized protein n=1 Tax=Anguilla anguilla TaxID=7936 RepID=A0A0E9WVY9_ANGAN
MSVPFSVCCTLRTLDPGGVWHFFSDVTSSTTSMRSIVLYYVSVLGKPDIEIPSMVVMETAQEEASTGIAGPCPEEHRSIKHQNVHIRTLF